MARVRGHQSTSLFEAVKEGRLDDIRERLEAGEDVNAHHMMGRTMLHIAASKSKAALQLLLEFSPDIKKVDLNGNSPLHQAAFSNIPGSEEITELLIKAGVDLDTHNRFGRTAMDECVVSDNINSLKVLVKAGACLGNTLRLAREEDRPDMIKYLEATDLTEVDEKEELLAKLEYLEKRERKEIESKRKEKKKLLDKAQTNLRNYAGQLKKEIDELEKKTACKKAKLENFKKEEERKIRTLTLELQELEWEIDFSSIRRVKAEDLAKCLECPVCLGFCRKKVWQCPEGHVLCDDCANRPEMRRCPQCRISLRYISRNRGLEQLARITFPQEEVSGSQGQDNPDGVPEVAPHDDRGEWLDIQMRDRMELDQMRDAIAQMLEVGRLTGSMD